MGKRGEAPVLRRGLDALAAAALAPSCAACARPLDEPLLGCVCRACWYTAAHLPAPPWADDELAGLSAGRYESALRDIIHAFKYEGRRSLAEPLAALVAAAGAPVLQDADCVVPVPLHPWRRMNRGFNQAADLARAIGLPVAHGLWRTRFTSSQMALPAAARRTNVRGAFIPSPLAPPLQGRVVVLIDDVRTTGATLRACARALKETGVRETRALTIASADLRR